MKIIARNIAFYAISCFLLILFFNTTTYAQTSKAVEWNDLTNPPLLFLGNNTLPPMIYMKDDKPIGIVVDLAEAIKSRMSSPVSFKYMNWSQAQQFVLEGKADALLQINPSEERKKIYDFSDSLLESDFSIFISSDRKEIFDITSLRGLRVGVEENGLPIQIIKRDLLIKIVDIPNIISGFYLLAEGAVDAVVVDRWVGSFVVAENRLKKIKIADKSIEKNSSAIAVRKGNTKLLADINKALAEIKEDGTYKNILAKWGPKEIVFQTKEEVDRQKIILVAILCVLSVMIISGVFLLLEIKKRRQSERLLFQSENKLRATLDASPFPMAVVDLQDDKVFYWSQSALNLFGHTAPTAAEWYEIAYPDPDYRHEVIERWKPFLEIARESGQPVNTGEYQITCKDGSVRICELYVTFLQDNLIATFNDITARKKAEEMLWASDENFRSIFENNSVAIAVIEPDSTISLVNAEYCKVSGYTKQEAIGMSWTQQIPPKDLERLKEYNRRRLINPEDAPDKYEFTFYHKNGEIKHALMSVTMISNRKIITSFLDITERKRAEDTIRKISAAVEQSPVTIVITDTTGAIEYVNPKFTETTGYTFSEAIGQNPRILKSGEFPPEGYKELWDTILKGNVWHREFHNKKKNGELFWEQASISPIRDNQGIIISFVAVKEDITDRKRLEEDLLRLNKTLEQRVAQEVKINLRQERLLIQQSRQAAMGEMIGNIAHQWRQPLNALGLLIFNIKDAYQFNTLDAAYLDQAVEDGRRMVQKMSTTISDFSNFFRPGKEIIAFSALEQIREAIALVESSFQHSNISIHIDASQDIKLLGFPNEYSQVLLNLLSNAKAAILSHNQKLSGKVDIVITEQDGQGCVSVRDNGGGIPDEILDRIFEPYFSTKEKGSGIGLYMSKMIIERNMNGSITAINIEGGAEFNVYAPVTIDGSYEPS